jgi:Helix-turn-helix domain
MTETLRDRVNRAKARWLKTVMYSKLKSTQKVFAYVVFDCLNCVTLDAWPAQSTSASWMGCSIKTVQRAADALEAAGYIAVARSRFRNVNNRYAPVFVPGDLDVFVPSDGQPRPQPVDVSDRQSSLSIHIKPTSAGGRWKPSSTQRISKYKRAERGHWEQELSKALGPNGSEIIDRLAMIDDAVVERLCRALCDGQLGSRELEAARLAAYQTPDLRKIW